MICVSTQTLVDYAVLVAPAVLMLIVAVVAWRTVRHRTIQVWVPEDDE